MITTTQTATWFLSTGIPPRSTGLNKKQMLREEYMLPVVAISATRLRSGAAPSAWKIASIVRFRNQPRQVRCLPNYQISANSAT